MNRNVLISNIESLKFIAHRLGFEMTNYPENSLDVIKDIFEDEKKLNSCGGFEFDICFTKDHFPVVIHDKYIDDISNGVGLVKKYTIRDLEKVNFGFRKSLNNSKLNSFKIVTLENMLDFFRKHKVKLGEKIIKIETKETFTFNINNLKNLAETLNKYPELSNNIVHLSYHPQNLITLKRIQLKNNYSITKSDLLCDYNFMVNISRLIQNLDCISLRIKHTKFPIVNSNNTKRVNKKIRFDTFFMKFSNAISERNIKYAIEKYGSVGVYVLNDVEDITEFCKNISEDFFLEYLHKFVFTSDNPMFLKETQLLDK